MRGSFSLNFDLLERNSSPLLCDLIEARLQIVRPQYRRLTLTRRHNQDVVHGWAVSGTASRCTSTAASWKDEKQNDEDELVGVLLSTLDGEGFTWSRNGTTGN